MIHRCAECGRRVEREPVTIGRTTWGRTCARRLGLLKARTTRRYAAATPRVPPDPVEVLDGQPPLFGDDEGNEE